MSRRLSQEEYRQLLDLAIYAAKKAGAYITSSRPTEIGTKSSLSDLVTECDKRSEKIIRSVLGSSGIAILGEEFGGAKELTRSWVVDPIDGTYNFVKGSPLVGVNIALFDGSEVVLAVTYLPFIKEMYTAIKGQGVLFNAKKLTPPTSSNLEKPLTIGLSQSNSTNRLLGAASVELAWLARSIFTEVIYQKTAPWDVAPGVLFINELGGSVTSSKSIYWDDAHFTIFKRG